MDKVSMCLERIRLIKGVNYGVITNEQVKELFEIWDLDKSQIQAVYDSMKINGIVAIPESEVPNKVRGESCIKSEQRVLSEEELKQVYKERFDVTYNNYIADIEENPKLATQYESEIPIFANAVVNMEHRKYINVQKKIALAVVEVAYHRVADKRYISGCGTYLSHARQTFERWLNYVFSEKELIKLNDACMNGEEFSDHQKNMIALFLHHAPKIQMRRKTLLDMLDD